VRRTGVAGTYLAADTVGMATPPRKRRLSPQPRRAIELLGECCVIRHLFQLPYDAERDFVPISMIEVLPVALVVRSSLPVKTLSELIGCGKQHSGQLTYGSTGAGLFLHLNGLQFANAAELNLRHVPYGQTSPFTDLLGGHIDMIVDALPPTLENIRAGLLRALAVTGAHRVSALPELPTFAEAGLPSFDAYGFYGLLAPKGTPEAIVARMQKALSQIVRDPDLRQEWESQGGSPVGNLPSEFAERIRVEGARYAKVVQANNIKAE
jgi:tripartite-type tricarboxylate transporter receptor subunit TctC